jgi:carboxypeptidase family protein
VDRCTVKAAGILAALLLALVAAERSASACECVATGQACSDYWKASAVFLGRVDSVTRDAAKPGARTWPLKRVVFTVIESYRGVTTTSVRVETGAGGGDCGYPFQEGRTYLVYAASRDGGGVLTTSICSRTRPAEDADADVGYARAVASGHGPVSRIVGDIRKGTRTLGGPSNPDGEPLAGVEVRFQRDGVLTARATTDEHGSFVLEGLPPGRYAVSLALEDHYYADLFSRVVELPAPQSCAAVDAAVYSNGRVAGRVVDAAGRPVAGLTVDLATAAGIDRPSTPDRVRALTDRSGRYELTRVPPGRFVVGINTQRDRNGGFPQPRVLFPGVDLPARASRITVEAGERIELPDFVLPPALSYVAIQGLVTDADGAPAVGARVFLKGPAEMDYILSEAVLTGADGAFVLAALSGREYRVFAERTRDDDENGPVDSSEQALVTAMTGAPPLTLKLRRRY